MSIQKKIILSYLIVFVPVTIFIFVVHLTDSIRQNLDLLHYVIYAIIGISVLTCYVLTWVFLRPMDGLVKDLLLIEKGEYKKVHEDRADGPSETSHVIYRISRRIMEDEQNLNILFEIGRIVSSQLHLQRVMDAIVDLLVTEFKLNACSIRLLDDDGNLRIKSQKGLSNKFVETATRKPTIDSYTGECFLTGKIVIINDAREINKTISTTLIVGENIQSFAVTPIGVEGNIIGVLVCSSRGKNHFHKRFNDVIYTISNQIGAAIMISQLYDEVYNSSQELEKKVRERTKELKIKTKQLIEAERLAAFGKMANKVAHELRNSLTVIGGFARRLNDNVKLNDPKNEYLGIIVDEVKVLEEKVSEIIKTKDNM